MGFKLNFLTQVTSLDGFKFLGDDNDTLWKKRFSRLFWIFFIALSFAFMAIMLRTMIIKVQTSTTINVDTNYRDWDNVFPAVSVCLHSGRSTTPIKNTVGKTFKFPNNTEIQLKTENFKVMQNLLFINYPMEHLNRDKCVFLNDTCGIDLQYLRDTLIPQDCNLIFGKVSFLQQEMNCSKIFKRFETEYGVCFVANSMYSNDGNTKEDDLKSFEKLPLRYTSGEYNELSLEISYKNNDFLMYKLFIHTPEELPSSKIEHIGLRTGLSTKILIKSIELLNQEDVMEEEIVKRNCRYPFERLSTYGLPYSYSYCQFTKRIKAEMETCNCTLPVGFTMNITLRACNVIEFECLHALAEKRLKIIKTLKGAMESIEECLIPSCISMEIIKIGEIEKKLTSFEMGIVKIEVLNKPTLRYVRRVSISKLDMIVQVGGIIGLFFGASFLSIIEIFYQFYRSVNHLKSNNAQVFENPEDILFSSINIFEEPIEEVDIQHDSNEIIVEFL